MKVEEDSCRPPSVFVENLARFGCAGIISRLLTIPEEVAIVMKSEGIISGETGSASTWQLWLPLMSMLLIIAEQGTLMSGSVSQIHPPLPHPSPSGDSYVVSLIYLAGLLLSSI